MLVASGHPYAESYTPCKALAYAKVAEKRRRREILDWATAARAAQAEKEAWSKFVKEMSS
jgi:hypothetical protein